MDWIILPFPKFSTSKMIQVASLESHNWPPAEKKNIWQSYATLRGRMIVRDWTGESDPFFWCWLSPSCFMLFLQSKIPTSKYFRFRWSFFLFFSAQFYPNFSCFCSSNWSPLRWPGRQNKQNPHQLRVPMFGVEISIASGAENAPDLLAACRDQSAMQIGTNIWLIYGMIKWNKYVCYFMLFPNQCPGSTWYHLDSRGGWQFHLIAERRWCPLSWCPRLTHSWSIDTAVIMINPSHT